MAGLATSRTITDIHDIARDLRDYLGLTHTPVGVKLLEEAPPHSALSVERTFCQFVRRALENECEITFTASDLSCPSAELTLGFREPRYAQIEPRITRPIKAVRVGPLEDADVVLLLLDPYQVMVLAILLGGISAEFRGEMALCGDAVARVLNTGRSNVTFPCPGARDLGGFQRNDVVAGLPFETVLTLPERMARFRSLGYHAGEHQEGAAHPNQTRSDSR